MQEKQESLIQAKAYEIGKTYQGKGKDGIPESDFALNIKNIGVTLYAFHLCHTLTDAPGEVTEDASLLWEKLSQLGEIALPFPGLKDLKSKLLCYHDGNYEPQREGRSQWLTDSGTLPLGSISSREGFKITAELEPFRLNDTYVADLTLTPESPDTTIEVRQLAAFNPDGCLLPHQIQASLGQTLWLSVEVEKSDSECEELAKNCAIALLQGTPLDPVLISQGKLFGGLLFEYEAFAEGALSAIAPDTADNPAQHCHILVSLNNTQTPTGKLFTEAYDWLRNLLCCRHKIRYVYYQSRLCYQDAREQYSELEKQGQSYSQLLTQPEAEARLASLKQSLAQVSTAIFAYDTELRNLQTHLTTIETNSFNYQRCLERLPLQNGDNIENWQHFLSRETEKYRQQIQTDLNYLRPGRTLFDQLIATLLGITDIEQVERDRQQLQKEKSLENTIKAVGVGVAIGTSTASVTASSFGRLDKSPLPLPFNLHPFAASVLFSLLLGLSIGTLTWWLLKMGLRGRDEGN